MKKLILILSAFISLLVFTNSNCENSANLQKEISITGKFESKKGVMDKISCYCYNSGYLTTDKGDRIAICLEIKDHETIKCKEKITFTGNYEERTHGDSKNNPCPSGKMMIFIAKKYICE